MWTRLVRISDPGQWFGKIHEPVTRVQHLVRTNSYVNATVSLVRRYGAVVCMKKRELTQDPDCTLALQHVLDLLTWASYPGQIFPVWTQVNIADDNLMMWNIWTICEHGLIYLLTRGEQYWYMVSREWSLPAWPECFASSVWQ